MHQHISTIDKIKLLYGEMDNSLSTVIRLTDACSKLEKNPNNSTLLKNFKEAVIDFRAGWLMRSDNLLHLAARAGLSSLIDELVELGISVNSINCLKQTPLFLATVNGHDAVVEKLLSLSKDSVNMVSYVLDAPLHLAVALGHNVIVAMLLDAGADSSLKNQDGLSAAHIAASDHNMVLLKLLAQAGADMNILNDEEKTPIEYLTQEEQQEFAEFVPSLSGEIPEDIVYS